MGVGGVVDGAFVGVETETGGEAVFDCVGMGVGVLGGGVEGALVGVGLLLGTILGPAEGDEDGVDDGPAADADGDGIAAGVDVGVAPDSLGAGEFWSSASPFEELSLVGVGVPDEYGEMVVLLLPQAAERTTIAKRTTARIFFIASSPPNHSLAMVDYTDLKRDLQQLPY